MSFTTCRLVPRLPIKSSDKASPRFSQSLLEGKHSIQIKKMTDFDPVDLALGSGKILTASNFGPVVATAQPGVEPSTRLPRSRVNKRAGRQ